MLSLRMTLEKTTSPTLKHTIPSGSLRFKGLQHTPKMLCATDCSQGILGDVEHVAFTR